MIMQDEQQDTEAEQVHRERLEFAACCYAAWLEAVLSA